MFQLTLSADCDQALLPKLRKLGLVRRAQGVRCWPTVRLVDLLTATQALGYDLTNDRRGNICITPRG